MAIAINGSGTITGITAGGLPDDVITTADIADDAITTAKILNLNVTTAKIATGIDSAKIGAGDVSNTEHAYLNSVSSNVQTQISAAGGAHTLVAKSTVAAATREFTLTAGTYDMGHVIYFHDVYPATAGKLYAYLSANGGSSYHASYHWANHGGDHDAAAINLGGSTDSEIHITDQTIAAAAYAALSGWMYIPNAASGSNNHNTWQVAYYENTSADNGVIIGLSANQASAVNHNYIKFAFSAAF